jgi:hypothetical protein
MGFSTVTVVKRLSIGRSSHSERMHTTLTFVRDTDNVPASGLVHAILGKGQTVTLPVAESLFMLSVNCFYSSQFLANSHERFRKGERFA